MGCEVSNRLSASPPSVNLLHWLVERPRNGRALSLLVASLFTYLAMVSAPTWLYQVEEQIGSLGWTLFSENAREERITLVVIDEKSLAEVGPWPWPRDVMAQLVNEIDRSGALLQIHDVVYPEPREGDIALEQALASTAGAVVAQVPALTSGSTDARVGTMTHGIDGLTCSGAGLDLAVAGGYVAAAEVFRGIPKGHNAALIDPDGGVRNSPALVCVDGAVYPSLALAAFMQLGPSSSWSASVSQGDSFFGPEALISVEGYPGLQIPVDGTGAMRIDFHQAPESFRAVSASDVLAGRFGKELLEGAWVIVGGTAFGMADIVPTPYSGAAFGVELQARILASVLDLSVPFTPAGAELFFAAMIIAFSALAWAASVVSGRAVEYRLSLLVLLLPAVSLGTHIYFLQSFDMWLGWTVPALFGFFAPALMLVFELAKARLERGVVYQNLASYLSPAVAKEVAFSLPSSYIDAERRDVTLLSADIRNFAAFGESRPPEEIAAVLHYFSIRANEIVESFGGRVAEFRGDSALAIWEGAGERSARNALDAAAALQIALCERLLDDHNPEGFEPMALGIGIDQGPVLIGSIGSSDRRSFTVLGDAVSATLRIREMTTELAQPILIGAAVARHLVDRNLQSQGSFLLPGLRVPRVLFAPAQSAEVVPIDKRSTNAA
jgi:adenylate cyclase